MSTLRAVVTAQTTDMAGCTIMPSPPEKVMRCLSMGMLPDGKNGYLKLLHIIDQVRSAFGYALFIEFRHAETGMCRPG